MIRKRKPPTPMRLDPAKRRRLTWNSFDGVDFGSLSKRDLSLEPEKEILEVEDLPGDDESKIVSLASSRKTRRKSVTDQELQRLIDSCDFYLTIFKDLPKQLNLFGVVGRFSICPSEPSATLSTLFRYVVESFSKFWLYVDKDGCNHFVFVKMNDLPEECLGECLSKTSSLNADKNMYFNIRCSISPDILAAFQPKDIVLRKSNLPNEDGEGEGSIQIEVCLTEAVVFKHLHDVTIKKLNSDLQLIMSHFYGTKKPETHKGRQVLAKSDDLERLYSEIQGRKLTSSSDHHPRLRSINNVQPDNLRPLLRDYQKDAVRWMLEKEEAWQVHKGDENFDSSIFFEELRLLDGTPIYFNASMGIIFREKPQLTKASLGGILADEMGLGKTVEVLACILLNPRVNLPPLTRLPTLERCEVSDGQKKKQKCRTSRKKQYVLDHGEVLRKQNGTSPSNCPLPLSPPPSTDVPSSFPDNQRTSPPSTLLEHTYAKVSEEDVRSEKPRRARKKKEKKQVESKMAVSRIDGLNDFPFLGVRESIVVPVENGGEECNGNEEGDEADDGKEKTECICGGEMFREERKRRQRDSELDRIVVTCQKCGSGQHAGCVNYDLCDPFRGCYLCPHCHVAEIPIPSGATLIIAPNSILHQWIDEILKHISNDALKIFVYSGVHRQGFVQPMTLSRQDIVLTTYETLRKEIDYVDLPHTSSEGLRKFRHPKRFMAIPSPIVAVEWWRICLDEAQMVECTTTKTADMASRLTCINRWCVTGTPVQKGIDDLYGLFAFLRVAPFQQKIFWSKLLHEPYCLSNKEPLYNAISKVLWRNSKKDVIDQIQLPVQSNEMHLLTFSPVEEHFYRRLYEDCSVEVMQKLSKLTGTDVKLNSLDKNILIQLLHPLLKLRQACCHPQAVRGEFFSINKSTMTMTDLLDQLTKKVRFECEEAQRQIVMATNGLAGWYILKNDYRSAIQEYRNVISMGGEEEGKVRVDPLQHIHAVYNLQEILALCPPEVRGYTLRDSELPKMEKELGEKYMRKRIEFVTKAKEAWLVHKNSYVNAHAQMKRDWDWWSDLLVWIDACGLDIQLIEKVKDGLSDNPQLSNMITQFRDIRGLQYVLHNNLEKLRDTRTALVDLLQSIDRISSIVSSSSSSSSSIASSSVSLLSLASSSKSASRAHSTVLFSSPELSSLVSQTVQCCLRPEISTKNKCPFCKSHKLFEIYESNLFNFSDKNFIDQSAETTDSNGQEEATAVGLPVKRHGNWSDNEVERIFKNIIAMAQKYSGDKDMIEQGLKHLKVFEILKKEFKFLRVFWQALREQVSSVDEITMGVTRIRLREDYEEISDPPQPHIIERALLEEQKQKLVSDRVVGQHLLKKKKSQLQYLKGLMERHSSMEHGFNPEPCPVCQNKLGSKWSVLQCCHCFCLRCMRVLANETHFQFNNNHQNPQQVYHHRSSSSSSSNYHGRNRMSLTTKGLMCPVCRQVTTLGDVSYVSTMTASSSSSMGNTDKYHNMDIKVKGEWSTKIEGIVRVLLHIIGDDPEVKVLIFSTWQDVLELLSKALLENDITFCSLANNHKFEENLHHYKEDTSIRCLLLPIHSGSNGLNLTESTHVLLVEPVLNPAQELQAIGRVHRIGQTKPTFVHRFLVKGTIEEKLHALLSNVEVPTEWRNSEETTLTLGDLGDLFTGMPPELLDDDEEDSGDGNGGGGVGVGEREDDDSRQEGSIRGRDEDETIGRKQNPLCTAR